MKKLFLSLLFALLSTTALSKETITVVYAWTAADVAANFHRTLVDEANRIQNKYIFVFDTKPGAGGSIAANHVANTPNTVLATASAFFIRPNFFPNESHDLNNFKELMPQCSAPGVITSSKYRSWKDVPTDQPLTIGMSGMGTTTHLIATQVAKKYPKMTVVPYKSTSEAVVSVLSGNIDFAVNFMGDSAQYTEASSPKKIYMLGITGDQNINGVAPLISQGFTKSLARMNVPAQLVVPKNMPDLKFNEIREILVKAGRAKTVNNAFAVDYCQSLNQMLDSNIQGYYNLQVSEWQRLSSGVSLK
jgi:tripartite-type tricarboxylate transporter receptor subunit TctC